MNIIWKSINVDKELLQVLKNFLNCFVFVFIKQIIILIFLLVY